MAKLPAALSEPAEKWGSRLLLFILTLMKVLFMFKLQMKHASLENHPPEGKVAEDGDGEESAVAAASDGA